MPSWSSVITAVSIPSTIAVYGNGKTLGLTNGTNNFGLIGKDDEVNSRLYQTWAYNKSVTSTTPSTTTSKYYGLFGLSTATDGASGIVAKSNSITKTSQSYKFCIKY